MLECALLQPQQPAIAQQLPQHEPVAKPDAIHAAQAPARGKGIKRGAEGEPKEVPEAIRWARVPVSLPVPTPFFKPGVKDLLRG